MRLLDVIVNLAYVLMLCAFIARDILYLRGLLVAAQTLVVIYTWKNGVPVISVWNGIFAAINLAMVVQILRARRAVVLPEALQPLYERHFSALSPPEFLRWWRQGRRDTLENSTLASAGERPAWLYFLLSGTVRVSRNGRTIVDLPAGYFVAEMSLMTGAPANADVHTVGTVDVIRWATHDLHLLRGRDAALWTKIQSVIGHDLVEKIRRSESQTEYPT